VTGTGRHRTRGAAEPAPDPRRRPVLLHYAATGWPAPRRWPERLALLAGAIAVLAAIGGVTLTGAWGGFSLLGAPVEPARPAVEAGEGRPGGPAAAPPPRPDSTVATAPCRRNSRAPGRWTGPSPAGIPVRLSSAGATAAVPEDSARTRTPTHPHWLVAPPGPAAPGHPGPP
jgi:hypothetical protein